MLFCGQCGLRLSPGDKQCPRCGTPVAPGAQIEDDVEPDAPTVASPSLLGQMQTQTPAVPNVAGEPQRLILRPAEDAGTSNYGTQDAYEATRRMELPEQGGATTAGTPSNPAMTPSHPADFQTQYSQNRSNYPSQDIYAEYPQSGGNYVPQGMGYQSYPGQQTRTEANARGRTAALFIILVGLLLILVAMTLFILERNNVFGSINSGNPTQVVIRYTTPLKTCYNTLHE
ncbi:MAG: zinc ribbon domain-containing protein [Ktedonobacteraceae bacterium]|nr:zinc ribbon domain-containing protein [Ktedonobacteraceae bacterium]